MLSLILSIIALSIISILFASDSNYCYVSNQMKNYQNSKYLYNYPSIYFNEINYTQEGYYTCDQRINKFWNPTKNSEIYNCSIKNYCPITKNNIQTAMYPQQWNAQYHGFKNLIHILRNRNLDKDILIVVIGGSFTYGDQIDCGCYCNGNVDIKCSSNDITSTTTQCIPAYCTWSWYFIQWFKQEFPIVNFKFINLAIGGQTSKAQAESINSFELTENDIVFIDESVNDASFINLYSVKQGLELLLRRLYSFADNQKPTIIILEQFPFPHFNPWYRNTKYIYTDKDYAIIYRNLSRHYGTILISIRDIYWSYFNISLHNKYTDNYINNVSITIDNANKYPINPSHTYPLNPFKYNWEQHPPWYVHLYMADIVSACFMKILHDIEHIMNTNITSINYLEKNKEQNNSNSLSRLDYIKYSIINENRNKTSLIIPLPMYDIKSLMHNLCQNNFHLEYPMLINIQSNSTYKPYNTRIYEGYNGSIDNIGWREYIDYHDVSGWIINNYSNTGHNKLSFPFININNSLWNTNNNQPILFNNYILNIGFLQSYEGMGLIDIYVCGIYIATLDGLNIKNHFSIPIYTSFQLNKNIIDQCKLLNETINIKNNYIVSNLKDILNYKSIDFIYHPINTDITIRKNRKFKLISVHICMPTYF